ncbi:MAG: primosomal protein N' [marine bacterium B5-7]|nr:MAG: primosomal protein N' [marine bacterium B5-7]
MISVAVAAPLSRHFDYALDDSNVPAVGARVLVPFGSSTRVGFVVSYRTDPSPPTRTLKPIIEIIDETPLFDDGLRRLLEFAADYYQHPLGEVMQAALPSRLRKRLEAPVDPVNFVLTDSANAIRTHLAANAARQYRVVDALEAAGGGGLNSAELRQTAGECGNALKRLESLGLIRSLSADESTNTITTTPGPTLNPHQLSAVERIISNQGRYECFLLEGVTGSGKTEVYLECARRVIANQRQVLVLVPEIALTPQLISRFRERLGVPVSVLHSGLADGARQRAWLAAKNGLGPIVLGTRSAVFAALPRAGLIVIDEEHDPSFKQQDGFRYNARDIAIKRASMENIPIVLGSATPSLESYYNARRGRYTGVALPQRAGSALMPALHLIDSGQWPLSDGLTRPLIDAIERCLKRGEQSLIFINRRGFAPVTICGHCGWQGKCSRCDAFLTLHQQNAMLRCHHCGSTCPAPTKCPDCGDSDLFLAGVGTQRVEAALARLFPEARVLRIDRDSSAARGALESHLEQIRLRQVDIVVGTQILSKGHDFPGITLVGVLNSDQALYSVDFRAAERLFQSITQVAGRAGRASDPGRVLVQTAFADHPLMRALTRHDYAALAETELELRRKTMLPPFGYLALLRAESINANAAVEFLKTAADIGHTIDIDEDRAAVTIMDPVPAPMERRAGRTRAQLMIQSTRRAPLRIFLSHLVSALEAHRSARSVRWSVDVDPIDLY